jgi:hypothetical protein
LIWANGEAEYFFEEGWTADSLDFEVICPSGSFDEEAAGRRHGQRSCGTPLTSAQCANTCLARLWNWFPTAWPKLIVRPARFCQPSTLSAAAANQSKIVLSQVRVGEG